MAWILKDEDENCVLFKPNYCKPKRNPVLCMAQTGVCKNLPLPSVSHTNKDKNHHEGKKNIFTKAI